MGKQLKKKPISIMVNGKRLFKIYGNAKEVQTFFGSLQHDKNDKMATSFRNSDEAIEHSTYDMVHAMGSYEEKLGKSFRNLQRNLATGGPDSVDNVDAVGEYQSLSAVDSYEDKLGKSFRNLYKSSTRLNKSGGADTTEAVVDYPFSTSAGSYEDGLGGKFQNLQKGISQGKANKSKSSGAAMVAAAKVIHCMVEAPPSTTSVTDELINAVDNLEKKFPKMKAMKFKMGASLKNVKVKESVSSSKVDAINRNNAKGTSGTADYSFSSAAGSYEEGLGKKFQDLQKRISMGTINKGKNSGAGMVTAAKAPSHMVEAPPSPTSVADTTTVDAMDNALKFKMGAMLKNVKESVSSKVDAVKKKSTLKQETVEEKVAPKEKMRTPVASTSHDASFENTSDVDNELRECFEEDVNMEPNIEVMQCHDSVAIGFYEPHPKPQEDEEEGDFDLSATAHDLSLMINGAVVQTLTLGTQAMDQMFSFFSYTDEDQQENNDLSSDTPQQNEDCPKEMIIPLADAPSEEEASTDAGADNGELGQSSIDPSINSRLEQLEDHLEASPAANDNNIEATEQLSPAANDNDSTLNVVEQSSSTSDSDLETMQKSRFDTTRFTKQMISYIDNRTDEEDTYNGLNTEEDDRNDCSEENTSMNSCSEEARQEMGTSSSGRTKMLDIAVM